MENHNKKGEWYLSHFILGSPHAIIAKVFDCDLEVNDFELQLHNFIQF